MEIEIVKEICETIGLIVFLTITMVGTIFILLFIYNNEIKTKEKQNDYLKNLTDEQKAKILEYNQIRAKIFERKKK